MSWACTHTHRQPRRSICDHVSPIPGSRSPLLPRQPGWHAGLGAGRPVLAAQMCRNKRRKIRAETESRRSMCAIKFFLCKCYDPRAHLHTILGAWARTGRAFYSISSHGQTQADGCKKQSKSLEASALHRGAEYGGEHDGNKTQQKKSPRCSPSHVSNLFPRELPFLSRASKW